MRFSVRFYDIKGREGFETMGYFTRFPNYTDMMDLCKMADLNHIVDFKDDRGCKFTDRIVHGRLLRNRFNGMTPAGRYEIIHLTDDEVELEEVLR